MTENTARARWLVETDWLAAHLHDPKVRILDCTIAMSRNADGGWQATSGRAAYEDGHIPGAQFVDLQAELFDAEAATDYMLPAPEVFAARMGELGIGSEHRVVVYASAVPWWATRLWWMFRAFGHDDVAVLNGGYGKWAAEGRRIETAIPSFAPARFEARYRPELVADKEAVRAAVTAANEGPGGGARVVNALSRQLHTGESDLGYARPGRIAGSLLLPALALVDEAGCYRSDAELAAAVTDSGIGDGEGVICYCGGGIAATMDAFALALLGRENVAVYDASLQEWAADPELPMQTGPA